MTDDFIILLHLDPLKCHLYQSPGVVAVVVVVVDVDVVVVYC